MIRLYGLVVLAVAVFIGTEVYGDSKISVQQLAFKQVKVAAVQITYDTETLQANHAGIELYPISTALRKREPNLPAGTDLYRLAIDMCAPWMHGRIELRYPEVLQSSMGFHILDHSSPSLLPLSDPDPMPQWIKNYHTGGLMFSHITAEGLVFGGSAEPGVDEVSLEFFVENRTSKPIENVEANMCLDMGSSPDFNKRFDLDRLFIMFDSKYQSLAHTTPTPADKKREPWLLILTRQGEHSFTGGKDSLTWWLVDQIADENIMATQSEDGKHLIGYTWNVPGQHMMTNCGNPCMHTGPGAIAKLASGQRYTWYGKVYFLANDPNELLKRYHRDQESWKKTLEKK